MAKILKKALVLPSVIVFVFILSMMPLVIFTPREFEVDPLMGERTAAQLDRIDFMWSNGFQAIRDYINGVKGGESFRFYSGMNEYSFWQEIGGYLKMSMFYVSFGTIVGLTAGIMFGIGFALFRNEWVKRTMEMIGVFPDFMLIILLQFVIVQIAKETGFVLFKVANVYGSQPAAIALPIVSMIVIPGLYIARNVAVHMRFTLAEDYISAAKSRGLGKLYITFFHALPNVLPFIKADLHKFMGILMGNLFIVEYLYNIKGITKLLFKDAMISIAGYQFALVVNGMICLLLIYGVLYFLLRMYLFGWEKVFAR
ncbi:ABC transporter permease subunit [Paenibacillus thermotolerans]|uniref:ABC transporter permease subunit n=1 Tax=Paenibacillus thermotolerans TaxID=3027807 RepID=UPI00236809B1|nr:MULTISPECIES: ABC transporter permease subunit [unclassified Paenibacillus]